MSWLVAGLRLLQPDGRGRGAVEWGRGGAGGASSARRRRRNASTADGGRRSSDGGGAAGATTSSSCSCCCSRGRGRRRWCGTTIHDGVVDLGRRDEGEGASTDQQGVELGS